MDIVTVLSTVILTATLATLILAVGSYTAFKVRERRQPTRASANGATKTFFTRYRSPNAAARGGEGEPHAGATS
jgi:hypothetical protein